MAQWQGEQEGEKEKEKEKERGGEREKERDIIFFHLRIYSQVAVIARAGTGLSQNGQELHLGLSHPVWQGSQYLGDHLLLPQTH